MGRGQTAWPLYLSPLPFASLPALLPVPPYLITNPCCWCLNPHLLCYHIPYPIPHGCFCSISTSHCFPIAHVMLLHPLIYILIDSSAGQGIGKRCRLLPHSLMHCYPTPPVMLLHPSPVLLPSPTLNPWTKSFLMLLFCSPPHLHRHLFSTQAATHPGPYLQPLTGSQNSCDSSTPESSSFDPRLKLEVPRKKWSTRIHPLPVGFK